MKPANPAYDVVIVGAGIVGTCLALALGRSNKLKIALIEANTPPSVIEPQQDYDLRVSAISRASEAIFNNLNAWQGMQAQRLGPFREMHVWDAAGTGAIHFDSAEIGEPHLGHIIENRAIQTALLAQCQSLPNIDLHIPARSTGLTQDNRNILLTLEEGRRLPAQLLIGADGTNSLIRQWAHIGSRDWDYRQTGVVTTVWTEKPHRETAWQRFLSTGPLAFLPLNDPHRCSIVWSTTPAEADRLLALEEREFAATLAAALGYRLGAIEAVGRRASFPLRARHARAYVQPRLALVGDAAHTIHPLAGQGVNLGLLDAASLAEVVLAAQKHKKAIGSLVTLRRFERWRKGDNLTVQLLMDGFKHLFGTAWPPVRVARNFGLTATDATIPLKRLLMHRASGLAGDLPSLARMPEAFRPH